MNSGTININFDPISSIIDLIDKGLNYFKNRRERKRSFFNEIIDPLFTELEKVAEDYYQLFSKAEEFYKTEFEDYERDFSDSDYKESQVDSESNTQVSNDFEKFVDILKEHREKLLLVRIKVRQMSIALSEKKGDEELRDFAKGVEEYFFGTDVSVHGSNGKRIVELFDQLECGGNNGGHYTLYFIEKTKQQMETAWAKISKCYQLLKLKNR